jgi:hypothetical protein
MSLKEIRERMQAQEREYTISLDRATVDRVYPRGGIIDTVRLGPVTLVIVRGTIDDWAAYIGPSDWLPRSIAEEGHKLTGMQAIGFIGAPEYTKIFKYRE